MVAHGWIRSRWDFDAEATRRGNSMQNLPNNLVVGSEKLRKTSTTSFSTNLKCEHYFDHVYYNQELDASAEVATFFGNAGPIAVHTPDVCYRHSDYKIVDTQVLDVGEHQFKLVVMERKSVDQARIHVCFAWLREDHWEVTDSPRFAYAFTRHLYKMQMVIGHPSLTISREENSGEDVGDDMSLTMSFLKEFADSCRKTRLVQLTIPA